MKKIIEISVISISILMGIWFLSDAIRYHKNFNRVVRVKGLAEKKVKSDLAIWTISIGIKTKTRDEQYSLLRNQKKVMIDFLSQNGIDKKNVEFSNISIKEALLSPYRLKKMMAASITIKQYEGSFNVKIISNHVDQIKELSSKLDELILKGVPIKHSEIFFVFTKINEIKEEMIKEATINARKAAQSFAQNSQNLVGSIQNATQGYFEINDSEINSSWTKNKTIYKQVRVVTNISFFLL